MHAILCSLILCSLTLCSPLAILAATPAPDKPAPARIVPVEIADGITLVPGAFVPGRQPDGNSVILDAPQGLIVFDTGRHAEHTQAVLDVARSRGKPVAAVVNSHWHLDHVGGNLLVREQYPQAAIYASGAIDGALAGFLANYRKQLVDVIDKSANDPPQQAAYRTELALIDAGDRLKPTERITQSGPREIAGRALDVHLVAPAVTAGDLWLYDSATRTLVAGDLVTLPFPLFDTACPQRWSEALAQLDAVDFRTLVPGHGAPLKHAQFGRYRKAFDAFAACAASEREKTACIEGWLKDARTLVPDGERELASKVADYYLSAVLRGQAQKTQANCTL